MGDRLLMSVKCAFVEAYQACVYTSQTDPIFSNDDKIKYNFEYGSSLQGIELTTMIDENSIKSIDVIG